MTTEKQNILFVDDDRHLTRSMRDLLLYEGYNVTTVATAEAALKELQVHKPDLVILDISMPGMGGIGFLKHISEDDGTLSYPVLVLTARAAMNEFFNMLAVDGFLPKPCASSELIAMVRKILTKQEPLKATTHKLLIGEDDPILTPGMIKRFSEAGFDVATVSSGPAVLEQAMTFAPDVIILKEIFPGMNGSAVSRLLKSIPKTEKIPIVLYDETREEGQPPQHSAEKYLFAPQIHELLAAVAQIV